MGKNNKLAYIFAAIIILLFWLLVAVVAYQRLATTPSTQAACNDYSCTNFREGSYWAIRNCQGTTTDGSVYTCNQTGISGSCGGTSYCCPGPGMLWTTDLSACAQVTPTPGLCACPTPTPIVVTSQCNGPCMTNANCTNGNVCLNDKGTGWVCRNPACYQASGCNCAAVTPTPTPTPINQVKYSCGGFCLTSDDCQSGLSCVSVTNTRQCRNPNCSDTSSCLCTQY